MKITSCLILSAVCARGAEGTASVRGAQRNHPHNRRSLQTSNDIVLELNAGVDDGAYVDGNVWSSTNGDAIDVSDVDEDYAELRFQSHRSGNSGFYYTIPDLESNQDYKVNLGFAENWHGACSPTQRIFSVTCNGAALVSSLDVVAESGACYKALVESTTCTSNAAGALIIEFTSTVQNPMVSFVDILKSSGSASSIPTTVAVPATSAPVPVPVTSAPVVLVAEPVTSAPVVTPVIEPAPSPTDATVPIFVLNAGMNDDAYLPAQGVWGYQNGDDAISASDLYPASWFQSHRSGISGFAYTIPGLVAGESYELSIGFAENYAPNCVPGKRVLSVDCNGEIFVDSLDVFVAAGDCFKALVLSSTHTADEEGNMIVTFTSSVENPMLSVLEIKSFDLTAEPLIPEPETEAPVADPVTYPSDFEPTEGCQMPQFTGDWEDGTDYPLNVAESQGAMIKNDFVVVSGFVEGYGQSTAKNYAIETGTVGAEWREMDDIPISEGVTHGAFVVIGSKFYMCGGYLGGHPGPHIADCVVYDHDIAPGNGNQWSYFTPLPEGRAGGGMVYDIESNSLIFTGGAERPEAGNPDAYDYEQTWALSLSDINGEWVEKADITYLSNHMSYATGIDETGAQRHFFVGGQFGENEHSGNHDENVEYFPDTDTWVSRKSMPFTRGHASSSTIPVGCGYIIAAGSTNEYGQTADVSYYDIPTDSWTSIGNLPNAINTPVCDIDADNYLYCESGWPNGNFSYKRKMVLV